MSLAYADGNAGWGSSSPFTLELPEDIAPGTVLYVYASVFNNATPIGLSGMQNPGSLVQMYYGYNGFTDSFMVWAFLTGAEDAGATLTYTETGASTYIGSVFWGYSGGVVPPANPNGPNVGYAYANGGVVNTGTNDPVAPLIAGGTPVAGCWVGNFISAGIGDGDGPATLTGGTLRQQSTASGVNGFDSNGPVGPAGTAAGGGTFSTQADGPVVMVTIAIPPAPTNITVTGQTATATLTAPVGSVSVPAVVSGVTATEFETATPGGVSTPKSVAGVTAAAELVAPVGSVSVAAALSLDPWQLGGMVIAVEFGGLVVGSNMEDYTGNGFGGWVA